MSLRSIITKNSLIPIIWALLCGGLYLTSLYNYLLFHIVAESFSIVIALSLFMIAWDTRRLAKNNYVLFLSIAFLFAGLIDFVHTLAYKGMGIFQGFDANLPTQLWIIARYLQSLSLLAAPWFVDRKPNIHAVFGFYLVATLLLLSAVFSGTLFPACFVEGRGLTPFKIVSEYVICFILFISFVLLLRRREKFDPLILRLMVGSILFTIISELAFTFYISVYGLSNLAGHYFKIFAFYLVYRAIIVTGLENPYRLLFYDLQKNREELQIIIDASPIMIYYKDRESRFIRVNKAFAEAAGLPGEEIAGKTDFDIYPDQAMSYREDDKEVIASGKSKTGIIEPMDTAIGQRWLQTDKIPYRDVNGSMIGVIGFSIDITERQLAEQRLREEVALKSFLLGLLQKAPALADKDLYDYVLDFVVRMTDSVIGFLHLVSEDQQEVILTAWNTEALKNCTAPYATHYPLDRAGNWVDGVRLGRPVLYNEFSSSPNRKGLPEGHPPVSRFMSVPVVEGDNVRIIFGVGNKSKDYTELDAVRIQIVANDMQRIMAQRRAETALSSSEAYFRSLIENASDIITLLNADGAVRYMSPSLEHVMGYAPSALAGRNIFEYFHPDDISAATELLVRAVQTPGVILTAEFRLRHQDGSWHIFEITAQNLLENRAVQGVVINSHDITARRQAEEALLNSEQKLKAVLYGSPIPQFVIDRDHRVVYWNHALEEITGIRSPEVIGTNRHWRAFYDAERSCLADLMVDGAIAGIPELNQGKYGRSKLVAGAYEDEDYFPALGRDGKWLFFTAVVIRDVGGQVIGALETVEDITERKQAEAEILALSITDQLTGLHNRRGFMTLADQQLKLSDRTKRGMLLFFADLDGLKWINDTLGHEEGDQALVEMAAILKDVFRSVDIVARMGGDEFAILAIDSAEADSEIFTTRLRERIDTRNHRENRRYRLSLSIGCSCHDPENPRSLDELIVYADRLMYEQKRMNKTCR